MRTYLLQYDNQPHSGVDTVRMVSHFLISKKQNKVFINVRKLVSVNSGVRET